MPYGGVRVLPGLHALEIGFGESNPVVVKGTVGKGAVVILEAEAGHSYTIDIVITKEPIIPYVPMGRFKVVAFDDATGDAVPLQSASETRDSTP